MRIELFFTVETCALFEEIACFRDFDYFFLRVSLLCYLSESSAIRDSCAVDLWDRYGSLRVLQYFDNVETRNWVHFSYILILICG